MTRPAQTIHEREIFETFAEACVLDIDLESIESRDPQEPDIYCRLKCGEEILFELTELIDSAHLERVALMGNTRKALAEFVKEEISREDQTAFHALYSRALLHFNFAENSKLSDRRSTFAPAIELLLRCPASLSEFVVKHDPNLTPVLEQIRVRKSRLHGPVLDVGAFGWLGDPTETAITKKLKKSYVAKAPIELLAYVDWDLLPPEGAWKESAERAAELLEGSQFRRIWIFDTRKKEVLFVLPRPLARDT